MEDICNFIPQRHLEKNLQFIHFVYETNVKKLSQPFIHPNFYIFLVNKGSAVLKSQGKQIKLKRGDLFFTFPYQSFVLENAVDFTYLYISFNGESAKSTLNSLNINNDNFIFTGFEHLLQFWMDSIIRVNQSNAYFLAESVLSHTLSYVASADEKPPKDKFEYVLTYINHNYTTKDMSIKKVAGIFFYSEKYLSSLFVKNTGVKFSNYLNNLRINYAKKLINQGETNISDISFKCGYNDQFYFSKVFKTLTNVSPSQYIKSIGN